MALLEHREKQSMVVMKLIAKLQKEELFSKSIQKISKRGKPISFKLPEKVLAQDCSNL